MALAQLSDYPRPEVAPPAVGDRFVTVYQSPYREGIMRGVETRVDLCEVTRVADGHIGWKVVRLIDVVNQPSWFGNWSNYVGLGGGMVMDEWAKSVSEGRVIRWPSELLSQADTVSVQRLKDLLVTAVEGGSNYWARFTKPRPSGQDYDTIRVSEHEAHQNDTPAFDADVTAASLRVGLARLAADPLPFPAARRHLTNVLTENDDAETADVVLQMTIFGDVIYG